MWALSVKGSWASPKTCAQQRADTNRSIHSINIEQGKTLIVKHLGTTVYAERPGVVAEVLVRPGTQVEAGDLLLRFEG
jgi:multidrug resistance efflux pump